jgi:hypothetical protein
MQMDGRVIHRERGFLGDIHRVERSEALDLQRIEFAGFYGLDRCQ